jgi:hypothetical protein
MEELIMLKDYSGSVALTGGRNRLRAPGKKISTGAGYLFQPSRRMWETVGAMLLVTLVLGIGSTVWYSLQVQDALDQIGSSRAAGSELQNANRALHAKRDFLLTRKQIVTAARKIGLRPATENQLRYR